MEHPKKKATRYSVSRLWLAHLLVLLLCGGFVAGWLSLHMPGLRAAWGTPESAHLDACTLVGIPAGLSAAEWKSIVAAVEQDQYQVVARDDGTYYAHNPAHQLLVEFMSDGFVVSPTHGTDEDSWHWGLRLRGYGYVDGIQAAGEPTIVIDGNCIKYRRGDLVEWYVNESRGLEQGFTLAAPPGRTLTNAPLEVHLEYSPNWTPSLSSDLGSITWKAGSGGDAFEYTGLSVYDARDQELDSWFVVEDGRVIVRVCDSNAQYPITIDPYVERAKLVASDADDGDYLGYSIAMLEDVVFVGGYGRWCEIGGEQEHCGMLLVYEKPVGGWTGTLTESAKLLPSSFTDSTANFGISLAADGTTVVVGSYGGCASVFEEPIGGWSGTINESAVLQPSAGSVQFARSVAVSGDTVVVGDPGYDSAGAVFVYVKPGVGWSGTLTEDALLVTDDLPNGGDSLGYSVAIDGDTVVAGAIGDDCYSGDPAQGNLCGAAYVFEEPVGGWSGTINQSAKLRSSTRVDQWDDEQFGSSVAIDGDTVVVGAPENECTWGAANGNCGAVYVFVEPGGGWSSSLTESAVLLPQSSNYSQDVHLGESVAIDADVIIAGGPGNGTSRLGRVFKFVEPAGGWSEYVRAVSALRASDTDYPDDFGQTVAMDGDTVVVGAPGDACIAGDNCGSACVFEHVDGGKIVIEKVTDPDPCPDETVFNFNTTGGFHVDWVYLSTSDQVTDYPESTTLEVFAGSGYGISEQVDSDWVQTNAVCSDGSPLDNIDVSVGETVTCTFTNTMKGEVVLEKHTNPSGGAGFPYTHDIPDSPPYSSTFQDGTSRTFWRVPPGTYHVTEDDPEVTPGDYMLESIVFDDTNSTADLETRTATIVVDPGETVTCEFTNTRLPDTGTIIIEKQTSPAGGAGFAFTDDIEEPNAFTLDHGQSKTFADVPTGTYTIVESDPSPGGYVLTSVSCDDANSTGSFVTRTATIQIEDDETVTCVFTNAAVSQVGTIVVEKETYPAAEPGSFKFTNSAAPGEPFWLDHGQSKTFYLLPGTYYITEQDPTADPGGFVVANVDVAEDGVGNSYGDRDIRMATVNLEVGETVTCTFTNIVESQAGTITIEKLTDPPGAPDTFGFQVDIRGLHSRNLADGQTATYTNLLPGTYTVTENPPPAGFELASLTFSEDVTVNSVADLGYRTATIHLDTGETVTATFTNGPPAASADLGITKSDTPDPICAGNELTYTLSVANNGPDNDPETITVTDTLPAGVSYVSASGTGWSCSEADGVVTCTRSGLNVGSAPDITITVAVNAATVGTITNNVSVGSPTADGTPGNDSASEDTTVQDGVPPTPDPMTWSTVPQATSDTTIEMTATTAVGPAQGASPTGIDGLAPQLAMTMMPDAVRFSVPGVASLHVTVHDLAGRAVWDSGVRNASLIDWPRRNTNGEPAAYGAYLYTVQARDRRGTVRLDESGKLTLLPSGQADSDATLSRVEPQDAGEVEYYFEETSHNPGGTDSGWQLSPNYVDTGLQPETQYCYRVKARDTSTCSNETGWSAPDCATTDPAAQTGTIVIAKQTSPAGGTGFVFTDDIEAPNGFTLDHGESKTFTDVPPGTYSVAETDPGATPGGYSLTSITCDDGNSTGDVGARTAIINLEAGETVTCTFGNIDPSQVGTIVVEKETYPAETTGTFHFWGLSPVQHFWLDNGEAKIFNVTPGTYYITEDDPSVDPGGFVLAELAVSEDGTANSFGDRSIRMATVNLEVGETVTCTFVNILETHAGTISFGVMTDPAGAPDTFSFNVVTRTSHSRTLSHGETATYQYLVPGSYSITENPPPEGFVLSSLTYTEDVATNSSADLASRALAIQLDTGETVTATFTNSPSGAGTAAVFRVDSQGNVYGDQTVHATAFQTGAADVAEWVAVSEPVEPGDVLELDPNASSAYRRSRGPCSTLIAGVVSTEPGFALGSGESPIGKACIALVGIVPVNVTNEGGPILPGDLLVASSIPGFAMRWGGEPLGVCVLVGKALQPMTDESGAILVLLTAH